MKSLMTLSLVVSILSVSALAREIPVRSQRSLRQQVDLYLELLEKETNKAKLPKDKIAVLKRVTSQIQEVSRHSSDAEAADLQYTEDLIQGLKTVPSAKSFKTKNCNSYFLKFEDLAQSLENSETADEALLPTRKFFETLCPE